MATRTFQVTQRKDSGDLFSAIVYVVGKKPDDVTYDNFVVSVTGDFTDSEFNAITAIVGE